MFTATALFLLMVLLCTAAAAAQTGGGAALRLAPTAARGRRRAKQGEAATVEDERLIGELRAAGASAAAGVRGPVPDFRRRFTVVRTGGPPAINGRLDDEAWGRAQVLDGFLVSQGFNDPALPHYAEGATEARVLYDDKGLYVGVAAYQDPETIYTTIRENGWLRPDLDWESRGEPWANTGCDEIEIVIDPELTMSSHFVFQVNPDGIRKKLFMPAARPEDGLYKRIDPVEVADDRWLAATGRDEKGWYATVFVPWASIGFREITPAGPADVFVDMVQDRTVMGFNVNRVVHKRHEPSSWSASKGTMFFRDAHNFGLAYFAPHRALIEKIECGDFFRGDNRVDVTLRSLGKRRENLTLALAVDAPGAARGRKAEVRLSPGASRKVTLEFGKPAAGRNRLEVRLETAHGRLVDAGRFVFEVPEPVGLTIPKTILFKGESDFPVRVSFNLPDGRADSLRCRVLAKGKVVASAAGGAPAAGETTLPFEVSGLRAGEYVFEARAVSGGKTVASATAPFRVLADPFRLKFSGRAGKASAATGVPAGFAALADGEGAGRAPGAFDGEIAWLDEEAAAGGFLLWAVTPTDDFAADAPPRRAQVREEIRAFAAGGEYEAVSFGVFALEDLQNPKVSVTGLKKGKGGAIPAECIDIRAQSGEGYLVKPDVLGAIPAKTARRYFITVYVAPGTPAGLYRGALVFCADGVREESREVKLLVLPFALEDTPITGSIYGGLEGTAADRHLVADLFAHGLDNFTCMRVIDTGAIGKVMIHHLLWDLYKPTEENWLGYGAERFKAPLDGKVFANISKLKIRGPIVVEVNYFLRYLPCTPENARLFEQALRRIEKTRERHGLGEFVYHLVDEPSNHFTYDDGRYGRRYGLERVDFFGAVLAELGLRQYVTINSTGRGFDTAEKMPDRVDIWCPNFISDERQVERWSAPGKEIWLYNFAGDGPSKGAARSTYGFYAHRVRATGVTVWCHPRFVAREEATGKCVAKAAWEAVREGRDDARYIETLKRAIARASRAGGARAATAGRAQADLDAIISAYPALTAEKVLFERLHDASEWNKWRWILAGWILRLSGAHA